MTDEFLFKLSTLKSHYLELFVVTLVHAKGSAPQEVGAKIIIGSSGLLHGTVGGGKVEKKVIEHAQNLLLSGTQVDFKEWNLQTDIGMTCGGVCTFYFEKVQTESDWSVAIFGAGHVAQEVVTLLSRLDCQVKCIDPRLEWLDKLPDYPQLNKIHTLDMKSVVETLSPQTFIACMTMGHAYDLPVLEVVLKKGGFPFIGVIGSESKAIRLKQDLLKLGIDQVSLNNLKCPIGEDFGNNTPPEIAISIVSQLIITRDKLKKS